MSMQIVIAIINVIYVRWTLSEEAILFLMFIYN